MQLHQIVFFCHHAMALPTATQFARDLVHKLPCLKEKDFLKWRKDYAATVHTALTALCKSESSLHPNSFIGNKTGITQKITDNKNCQGRKQWRYDGGASIHMWASGTTTTQTSVPTQPHQFIYKMLCQMQTSRLQSCIVMNDETIKKKN